MAENTTLTHRLSGRQLTDQQRIWLEHYRNGINATEAARLAGYAQPDSTGPQLRNRLKAEIEQAMRHTLAEHVPFAISQLRHLAERAASDTVKLGAINSLLDRAGFKGQQDHPPDQQLSLEDQARQILALVGAATAAALFQSLGIPQHLISQLVPSAQPQVIEHRDTVARQEQQAEQG